jgi:hypothetical protein
MSVQVIALVLSDTPDLPSRLVLTLVALANQAAPDGRIVSPDLDAVCRDAHEDLDVVEMKIDRLFGLGYIAVIGDQLRRTWKVRIPPSVAAPSAGN